VEAVVDGSSQPSVHMRRATQSQVKPTFFANGSHPPHLVYLLTCLYLQHELQAETEAESSQQSVCTRQAIQSQVKPLLFS
jgi:hypothetical protein